jgi:hypothetical protein
MNEPEEILNLTNQQFKVISHYYNKTIEKPLTKENSFDIKKYKYNIISFDDNNKKYTGLDYIERIDNLEKLFSQQMENEQQFHTKGNNSSLASKQLLLIGTRKKYHKLI